MSFDPYLLNELLLKNGYELVAVMPPKIFGVYMFKIFVNDTVEISYGGYETYKRVPKDTYRVYDAVISAIDLLKQNVVEPFLPKLYRAYVEAGDSQANIVSVMENFIAKNPLPYPRITFSYNIYKLDGQRVYDGKTWFLILTPFALSKNKKNWLWIPINEDGKGSLYSFIVFRG